MRRTTDKTTRRRTAYMVAAVLIAAIIAATLTAPEASAGLFGKKGKGNSMRVERPTDKDGDPGVVPLKGTVDAGVDDGQGTNAKSDSGRSGSKRGASTGKSTNKNAAGGDSKGADPVPDLGAPPAEKKPDPPKPEEKKPEEKKEKKPLFAPKTELEKTQDRLEDAQKLHEKKKYKKSLEAACELIASIREHGYDKVGSDGKGKDADAFKAVLEEAFRLAEKSGGRVDEPYVPSGTTGKTLYFVF